MGDIAGAEWLSAVCSYAFLLLVGILAVAQLDHLWDEDDVRRPDALQALVGLILQRFGFALGYVVGTAQARQYGNLGRVFVAAGLSFAAMATFRRRWGFSFPEWTEQAALVTVLVGFIFIRRKRRTWRARAISERRARYGNTLTEEEAVLALPPTIDCSDKEHSLACANRSKNPIIGEVIATAARWRPRARVGNEREYHDKFDRELRGSLPEAQILYEETVFLRRRKIRPDLVIAHGSHFKKRSTLVEMKANLRPGREFDRMERQAATYLRSWARRGPLILCLCRTPPSMHQEVTKLVVRLRSQGKPVVALFAAP